MSQIYVKVANEMEEWSDGVCSEVRRREMFPESDSDAESELSASEDEAPLQQPTAPNQDAQGRQPRQQAQLAAGTYRESSSDSDEEVQPAGPSQELAPSLPSTGRLPPWQRAKVPGAAESDSSSDSDSDSDSSAPTAAPGRAAASGQPDAALPPWRRATAGGSSDSSSDSDSDISGYGGGGGAIAVEPAAAFAPKYSQPAAAAASHQQQREAPSEPPAATSDGPRNVGPLHSALQLVVPIGPGAQESGGASPKVVFKLTRK